MLDRVTVAEAVTTTVRVTIRLGSLSVTVTVGESGLLATSFRGRGPVGTSFAELDWGAGGAVSTHLVKVMVGRKNTQ